MSKVHKKAGPLNKKQMSKKEMSKKEMSKKEMSKKEMSKQQKANHSLIEKKRRLKINKEYCALKYLVPACRRAVVKEGHSAVDGNLHKLKVLQETVDYIQHLHRIISSQTSPSCHMTDVGHAVDVTEYRDSEAEFDFDELFTATRKGSMTSPLDDSKHPSSSQGWEKMTTPVWSTMVDTIYNEQPRIFSLPSPALAPRDFVVEKRTKIGHILN